ncbi:MAG TPA: SIS domain-containing protein [Anaerolineae bacterium]|nr:SIS domain-containing protein [Anaerolineae bacterium]
MSLSASKTYFNKVIAVFEQVQKTQSDSIEKASDWIVELFKKNGVLHVFGTGHSHIISEDLFFRAGGFAPVNAILDVNLTMHGGGSLNRELNLDRMEGYARIVLDNYDLRAGEIIIVISRSGINPIVIETAMLSKERGLKVIALTNLKQSQGSTSRHSNGKKLYEFADLVIDSCLEVGDACIEIGEGLPKVAPQSTVVCCAILQSIMAEVATRMYRDGVIPPVWISINMPGGDERISELREMFGGRRLKIN